MPKLPKKPKAPGLIGGLGVTFKTMLKGAVTVQYPHEREDPPTRARGVIALKEENCTVCMLCARQCPDWCIYIEGHKEQRPPRREGGRPRSVSVLDRFSSDRRRPARSACSARGSVPTGASTSKGTRNSVRRGVRVAAPAA